MNRYGIRNKITSIFSSQYGNIYIGSENGIVFYGSKTMETFTPIIPDIINNDVLSLHMDDHYLWIGSQNFLMSKGISKFDIKSSSHQFLSLTKNYKYAIISCLLFYQFRP